MSYFRICPKCGKQICHKNKQARNTGERNQAACRSCTASEINKRPGLRDSFISRYATLGRNTGADNAFYGKRHSAETIERLQQVDKSHLQTDAFRRKMSAVVAKGEDHYLFGKSQYQYWVGLYGEELANKMMAEARKKISIANSGQNNPMYGKPSPKGSGNGWSGWYQGWYFRSLRELTYVFTVLEPCGVPWMTGEKAKMRISYTTWDGRNRTYVPDFFVDNNRLVEIKPFKLMQSPTVNLKTKAAEVFCNQRNLKFEIIDPGILMDDVLRELRLTNRIRFLPKYEVLFQERYGESE